MVAYVQIVLFVFVCVVISSCLPIGDVLDGGGIQLDRFARRHFVWQVIFVWTYVTCMCVGGVSME